MIVVIKTMKSMAKPRSNWEGVMTRCVENDSVIERGEEARKKYWRDKMSWIMVEN